MEKLYRFSITSGTENDTCIISDCINGVDSYHAEFSNIQEANFYIDNCYKQIGKYENYNYYLRKDNINDTR